MPLNLTHPSSHVPIKSILLVSVLGFQAPTNLHFSDDESSKQLFKAALKKQRKDKKKEKNTGSKCEEITFYTIKYKQIKLLKGFFGGLKKKF